jgi:hypothetical protein
MVFIVISAFAFLILLIWVFFSPHFSQVARIYHILLIHSSVVVHLDCFYSLTVVNNTVINVCVSVHCILTYIPSDVCPGVILLDHMAVLFLVL